jgi:hypothetical protein
MPKLIIRKCSNDSYEIVYKKGEKIVETFPNLDKSILQSSNEAIIAISKLYMKDVSNDVMLIRDYT